MGGGWSGIIADRFKKQDIFKKKKNYEYPYANGTLKLLCRPRPPSTAEGNLEQEDDVEIKEGDKKGSRTEDSCELRLKFYDPEDDTFPIP